MANGDGCLKVTVMNGSYLLIYLKKHMRKNTLWFLNRLFTVSASRSEISGVCCLETTRGGQAKWLSSIFSCFF